MRAYCLLSVRACLCVWVWHNIKSTNDIPYLMAFCSGADPKHPCRQIEWLMNVCACVCVCAWKMDSRFVTLSATGIRINSASAAWRHTQHISGPECEMTTHNGFIPFGRRWDGMAKYAKSPLAPFLHLFLWADLDRSRCWCRCWCRVFLLFIS